MRTTLWEAGYLVTIKSMAAHERIVDPICDPKKRNRSNDTPSVVYPNRLKRRFHATSPQQKLVADITYISDGTHFYYLSAIQDLLNNEIVAWQISNRNDVSLVLDAVKQWTRKRDVSEAVFHSEQGLIYEV